MKTVCIGTLKGGVGKTSAVFHLSGILAETGYKVLNIDLDAQANLTNNYKITPKHLKGKNTIVNLLENWNEIKPEALIIDTEFQNINIIPASLALTATELILNGKSGREHILRKWLEHNKKYLNKYDYIIMDTNPSFNICNQNAFVVADSIVLISSIDLNSYEGLAKFATLFYQIKDMLDLKNDISAIIVNQFDKRNKLSDEFMNLLDEDEDLKDLIVKPPIPLIVSLNRAVIEGKPINFFDKKSSGYISYVKIVEELKKRGVF